MLRSSRHALLAALLCAAVLPYFLNLGVSSIWDANEAFYAQTPREMIEAGDYVTPSFNFQLRMNKPVLSYWNVAASYHLFGISEWSERLPIAIGAVVIIGTAFGLGRLLGGPFAGLFAALVLATSPRLALLARRIIIDIHITMWMGLVLLFFALAETSPRRRRLYLCLMYVAAGFGVLTKGPVAVFLPAVVFFIYLASQKRLGDLRHMMLPAGALISLAIVVPWYYFLYREHGWEYIGSFIFGENLGRYADAIGEQSRGLLFYIPVMLADLFPWSLMIPVALWWAIRGERQDRVARLLIMWIAAIVVFFSLSGTKEDLYILPIVPAEAALIGAMLARAIEGGPNRSFSTEFRAGPLRRCRRNGSVAARDRVSSVVGVRRDGSILARWRCAGRCDGRRWRARRCRVAVPPPCICVACRRWRRALSSSSGASYCARCPTSSATSQSSRSPTSFDRARASARSSARINFRCRAWCSICIGR